MELKSITINNYKSINVPQTIDLSGGLTTLTGKNGSGKTNVLTAVYSALNGDRYRTLKYKLTLKLDEAEARLLKEITDYSSEENLLEVYNDGKWNSYELKLNRKRGKSYTTEIKRKAQAITDLLKDLSESVNSLYEEIAQNGIKGGVGNDSFFYDVKDLKSATNGIWLIRQLNSTVNSLKTEVDRVLEKTAGGCSDEELYDLIVYDLRNNFEPIKEDFKVEYIEPNFTRFEKKFISVDREGLKKEIDRVNAVFSENITRINRLCKRLNTRLDKFKELYETEYKARREESVQYDNFLKKVEEFAIKDCIYLPSSDGGLYYENGNVKYVDHNYTDLLVEAYIGFKYKGEEREKILSEYRGKRTVKNSNLTDFIKEFEQELNATLPRFDIEMISRLEVGEANGRLDLYVIERNGDKVPFSVTSQGRKWFYTYYFIRRCLRPGAVLILDEPGAYLHPEAQEELLRDIEQLSLTNKVILCTHSPYMISGKNNGIHTVKMTDKGTVLENGNYAVLSCGLVAKDAILRLPKELILCEGPLDEDCLKAFIRHFRIDPWQSKYHVMPVNGSGNAAKTIEELLSHGLPVLRVVLDEDSREDILNKKVNIPQISDEDIFVKDIPKERLLLDFVGSKDGGMKCIEGMFGAADRKIFLRKNDSGKLKVNPDIENILKNNGCTKGTENNFRKLFVNLRLL